MNINLRKLEDNDLDYQKIYNWCQNKDVYEWFEQRILSFDEIKNKYQNKLLLNKQKVFIISLNSKDIGLVQIYHYENKDNIYEYDIFIGENDYLSKGFGKVIINYIDNYIFNTYSAKSIILRPFKRNIRAVKCYQKCGYKIINEYDSTDTLGNKEVILVLLKERGI